MENKKFNYIEFKIDLLNNELDFLEKYLSTYSNNLEDNDFKMIESKLSKLHEKLNILEKKYILTKSQTCLEKETKTETEIRFFKEGDDIKKYNEDIAYKVSQINFII